MDDTYLARLALRRQLIVDHGASDHHPNRLQGFPPFRVLRETLHPSIESSPLPPQRGTLLHVSLARGPSSLA